MQADAELLHSHEYLQAVVQFAAHTQALTDEEHQLLDRSTAPLERQGFRPDDTQAAADVSAAYLLVTQASATHPVAVRYARYARHAGCMTLDAAHTQGSPTGSLDVQATHQNTLPVLCQARVNLLDATWTIVQRRQERGTCPAVSSASPMHTC